MNKNTTIGLLLIGLILFGFSWYNNEQYKERQAEIAATDSAAVAEAMRMAAVANAAGARIADSLRDAGVMDSVSQDVVLGGGSSSSTSSNSAGDSSNMLRTALWGTEAFTTLENELMKITFSNKGGRVAAVQLKDYTKYNGDPLMLFTAEGSSFGLEFFAPERMNTADYYFTSRLVSDSTVAFRLSADSAQREYLEYVYTLHADSYMIDFKADVSHFKSRVMPNQSQVSIAWNVVSPQEEKGFQNENNYTTIAYHFPGEKGIEELGMSEGEKSEQIGTKVQWVAFKQQFFSSIIVYDQNFSGADVKYTTFKPTDTNIKDFNAVLTVPYSAELDAYNFNMYFGPNKFSILNQYDGYEFQELVPLGWGIFGWINRWLVIPTFDFFGRYIANFGIVILLLTIFIKLLIFPLTYKSYLSTAKMRLLKPDIDKISQKYPRKEDAMKKQQAVMEVYKSAGVSPMGGCLPMLIQFPILIAMFRFFPAAIELRGKSFLWADDLSSYDSILNLPFSIPFYGDHVSLFTLLMAVSLYFSSKINYSQNSSMSSQQMPGMKFMMLYMMPVMLLLWFNNYSSGLSYYYLLSNVITIGQTYAFRYLVNDDKLHQKLKNNAKRPIKKSKWSERLEAMQKAAAQQQGRK